MQETNPVPDPSTHIAPPPVNHGFVPAPPAQGNVYQSAPGYPPKSSKKGLWIGIAVGVVLLLGISFAGLMMAGHSEGSVLLQKLHGQMTQQDYAGIYNDAATDYKTSTPEPASDGMFMGISQRLGEPVKSSQTSVEINTNGNGTFLHGTFHTTFAHATGTETVVWKKEAGIYRLYNYNIKSDALLPR